MSFTMSYKNDLIKKRNTLHMQMSGYTALLESGKSLNTKERDAFDDIAYEIRGIEAQMANIDTPDFRTSTMESTKRTAEDEAFSKYLRTGDARGLTIGAEYRSDGVGLTTEPNTGGLSAGATGNDPGYLIPQGFYASLTRAMKVFGGVAADMHQLETDTGNPMPWPAIDPTQVKATMLTGENNQLALSNPYAFGQGMLNAWTMAIGPVLASLQLVADSSFDIDALISSLFGEAIGRKQADLALNGTGSGQPLGIYTSLTARGVQSGQAGGVVALGTATSVPILGNQSGVTELVGNVLSPASLLKLISAVDPAYRNAPDGTPTAKFYVNDGQLTGLREVVDAYGHPLLVDPSDGGLPTLWGYPCRVDNNISNLTASTVSGPIYGNLDAAFILRTVKSATIMRLAERYADYLSVGFLGYVRMEIRSNDGRAVAGVQPAAT
jgi:HK97 family phage major capsid protein